MDCTSNTTCEEVMQFWSMQVILKVMVILEYASAFEGDGCF